MEYCDGVHPLSSQSYIRRKRIGVSMKSLVYFSATWCSACKQMSPIINSSEVAEALKNNKVSISKVDADTSKDIMKEYGIKALPTMVIIDTSTGKILYRKVGVVSKGDIIKAIGEFKD
jgi:thiol-disulfide isomerase/thioredoxin